MAASEEPTVEVERDEGHVRPPGDIGPLMDQIRPFREISNELEQSQHHEEDDEQQQAVP